MVTPATTRIGMPLADFLEAYHEKPFELINGERHFHLPQTAGKSVIVLYLFRVLWDYQEAKNTGCTWMHTTFILPDSYDADWVTGSREPHVMVYAGTRIADYKAKTPEWRERPFP